MQSDTFMVELQQKLTSRPFEAFMTKLELSLDVEMKVGFGLQCILHMKLLSNYADCICRTHHCDGTMIWAIPL